jgi:hypothetical protein
LVVLPFQFRGASGSGRVSEPWRRPAEQHTFAMYD